MIMQAVLEISAFLNVEETFLPIGYSCKGGGAGIASRHGPSVL
jgi:hypothetical protein